MIWEGPKKMVLRWMASRGAYDVLDDEAVPLCSGSLKGRNKVDGRDGSFKGARSLFEGKAGRDDNEEEGNFELWYGVKATEKDA